MSDKSISEPGNMISLIFKVNASSAVNVGKLLTFNPNAEKRFDAPCEFLPHDSSYPKHFGHGEQYQYHLPA